MARLAPNAVEKATWLDMAADWLRKMKLLRPDSEGRLTSLHGLRNWPHRRRTIGASVTESSVLLPPGEGDNHAAVGEVRNYRPPCSKCGFRTSVARIGPSEPVLCAFACTARGNEQTKAVKYWLLELFWQLALAFAEAA